MSTSTPRLGLVKPDVTELMRIGDLILNANDKKIDDAMGANVVATDAAVPVGPFQGQLDFATTPNEFHVYTGTRWGFLAKDTEAWGLENHGFSSTEVILAVGVETKIIQVTCPNIIAGRKYLIVASFFKEHDGASGTVNYRLRFASGTTVTTAGTLIEQYDVNGLNTGGTLGTQVDLCAYTGSIGTGQVTVGLFCNNTLANTITVSGSDSDQKHLGVFDCGNEV